MKPKVNWRCLKTDAPKTDGRYWFAGSQAIEPLWLDSNYDGGRFATDTKDGLLRLGWTHWAPYEAPEPPPKPTPFEVWWKKNTDEGDGDHERGQVGIVIKTEPVQVRHWVLGPAAKQIYEAGYADCAKNMVNGGAK
jgi:hypothetical protein